MWKVLGIDTPPHVEILAQQAPSPPPPTPPPPVPPPPSAPPSAPPPWWTLPCPIGTEQVAPDGECEPCEPGEYQADGAGVRQECRECENGFIQPFSLQTRCLLRWFVTWL